MHDILVLLIPAIFGGSAIGFVQFMIQRKDNSIDKKFSERFDRLDKSIADMENSFNQKIDALDRKIDDVEAKNARIRILHFSEEIQRGEKHSKESFDQVHQDIDDYNKHCRKYEDYENSRAEDAIANIESIYQTALKLQAEGHNGFLS